MKVLWNICTSFFYFEIHFSNELFKSPSGGLCEKCLGLINHIFPPFCKSMAIQLAWRKCFLEIVDRNFTDDHPYCKVFNRKTLKVSYSCMPNMKQLLMAHNRKMSDTQDKERQMCDSRKEDWPVNGSCLMENVIYRASVTTENRTKFYVSFTGLTFKNLKYCFLEI